MGQQMKIKSYAEGHWVEGEGDGSPVFNAINGELIGNVTSKGLDFKGMHEYARKVGGPNLRKMTFHERGRMMKELALYLTSKKAKFYEISKATGATKTDSWIDIDGGINTVFTFASKARRELPDAPYYLEGNPEMLSKSGSFIGHHIVVPLEGVGVQINAFNFPCWGMLEKLAPTLIAGVPSIVKPASLTCYLTQAMVEEIVASGILPEGAIQLICGSSGDLLDHLDGQDVVTFTGSATTGRMLKSKENIVNNAVRFNMEADSLNFAMLGADAAPESEEFNLFVKEVVREMTVKAGQKCTAIRRIIVPEALVEPVIDAINLRLHRTKIGDPSIEGVRMGPLAGREQVEEVTSRVNELMQSCKIVSAGRDKVELLGGDFETGAFFPATLLYCEDPLTNFEPHNIEAFGPVSTVMPYKNNAEAIELAKLGQGSLVGSVFTADNDFAKEIFLGTASHHGRIMLINAESAAESTGHGSPMPHLVHGGPGRAGGGEELGGIRAVLHYMQRTAIQGSPTTISHIAGQYIRGAKRTEDLIHPFRKYFEELKIGESLQTHRRTITEADIVNFANISGDNFYAHTDITSLEGTLFKERVAHGYFIIAAAAGLFVDPKKGPVLANYGIEELRFMEPVYANDTIYVNLTVKEKIWKEEKPDQPKNGIVKWDVEVLNQRDEPVCEATILTLVARKD